MNESEGTSTAVATIEQPAKSYALRSPIAKLLDQPEARALIEPLLPHGLDYNRVVAEVYRAASNEPKILKCTPKSIINAVSIVVQSGLVIGKTIYLVPTGTNVAPKGQPAEYEERLQAWFDYRGEIELVIASGAARHVDGHCVYEHEPFAIELGTNPSIKHTPILDQKKRGKLIGGYAYAVLPGKMLKVFPMTIEEIDSVRANSRSWKGLNATPPWYVIKTCIHRVTKTLPKNPALAKIIALFDREEEQDVEDAQLAGMVEIGSGGVAGPDTRIDEHEPRAAVGRASAPAGDDSNPFDETDESGMENDLAAMTSATPERKRFAVEEERCPMGPRVGYPLWMISSEDLLKAYEFARTTTRYRPFTDAAESVLENRRNGDIPEPTEAELALPKPPLPKAS